MLLHPPLNSLTLCSPLSSSLNLPYSFLTYLPHPLALPHPLVLPHPPQPSHFPLLILVLPHPPFTPLSNPLLPSLPPFPSSPFLAYPRPLLATLTILFCIPSPFLALSNPPLCPLPHPFSHLSLSLYFLSRTCQPSTSKVTFPEEEIYHRRSAVTSKTSGCLPQIWPVEGGGRGEA